MALDPKIAEILDKLESLDSAEIVTDDEWKTRGEWQAAWGVSTRRSEKLIRDGVHAGLMEHTKRPRKLVNGVVRSLDCYRWVGEGAKKKAG